MPDIFKTVEQSYDLMGETYHAYRNNESFKPQLEQFVELLPDSGTMLDTRPGLANQMK